MQIQWDEKYCIGIGPLDKDHERIIGLANELADKVIHCDDSSLEQAITEDLLVQLIECITNHLEKEENLMRNSNYPEIIKHTQEHVNLMKTMEGLLEEVKRKQAGFSFDAFMLVRQWGEQHVLIWDKQLAEFLKVK